MSIQKMYKDVFIRVYFDGSMTNYNKAKKYSQGALNRLWKFYIENQYNKGSVTRAEKEKLLVEG